MEPDRIEQIRAFGDRLAAYTRKRNSKKFFRAFYIVRYPDRLRDILLNANKDAIKSGDESLFDMDSYIDVFEDGVENYRSDWRLARDLVLMRMMDSLKDWLAQNLDAFPVQEPGTDDAGDENETATATNV